VYIACSDVVVEEFSIAGNKYGKYVFFLLGSLMIALLFFVE
jgi:hypothetical protein